MNKIMLLLFLCSLILSCGKQGRKEADNAFGGVNTTWNTPIEAVRIFNDDEIKIATRVCNNLQAYHDQVKQNNLTKLKYSVEKKECYVRDVTRTTESGVVSQFVGDNRILILEPDVSTGSSLNKDYYSVNHPRIAYICSYLSSSNGQTNTMLKNITSDGSIQHRVHFFTNVQGDFVEVISYSPINGVYLPYQIDFVRVNSAADESRGINTERTVNKVCNKDRSGSYIKQILLKADN